MLPLSLRDVIVDRAEFFALGAPHFDARFVINIYIDPFW
jgi:hypothetical protein